MTYVAGSGLARMGLVLLDLSRRALSIDGICSLIGSSFKFSLAYHLLGLYLLVAERTSYIAF